MDGLYVLSITSSFSFISVQCYAASSTKTSLSPQTFSVPPSGVSRLPTWAPAFPERHVSGGWFLSLDLMHLRWVCIARVSSCLLLAVSVWWVLERAETLYLSSWTCDEHCRVAAAPHLSSLWNNWDAFGLVVSLWLLPFTCFCNLWCFFHERRNGVWLQKMVELIHNLWITC